MQPLRDSVGLNMQTPARGPASKPRRHAPPRVKRQTEARPQRPVPGPRGNALIAQPDRSP